MEWRLFFWEWRWNLMRIIEINIDNFGKLNNFHMTFNKGINIIYGENESGKTTVFEFIRGMFFGFENEKGRSVATNKYKKYLPWNQSVLYKGSMRIESDDGIYVIKRDFYKGSRSFSCIEEVTGKSYTLDEFYKLSFMENMDEAVFDNVIYTKIIGDTVDLALISSLEKVFSKMEISFNNSFEYLDGEIRKLKKRMDYDVYNLIMDNNKKLAYVRKSMSELEEMRNNAQKTVPDKIPNRKKMKYIYVLLGIVGVMGAVSRYWLVTVLVFLSIIVLFIFGKSKRNSHNNTNSRDYDVATGRIFELKRYEDGLVNELARLDVIQEDNKRIESKIKGIELAKKVLEDISKESKRDFKELITPVFQKYLEIFSAGKYKKVIIDDSFNITVLTDSEYVEVDFLSTGARKQLNLALRYAISLCCKMTDFYFFDDAFVCFDDTRLEEIFNVLARNNMGQIFIATCTCREENILEKLDISYGICFMEEDMENG